MFTLDPATGQVNQIAPLLLSLLTERKEYILTVLTEFDLLPWKSKSNADLLTTFEQSTFQNAHNREYILTLAFELFVALGHTETVATIIQRVKGIAGDRPLLIDHMTGSLLELLTQPTERRLILEQYEDLLSYLNALQNVHGIDSALVDQAVDALKDAHDRP
jgi:hypothetical protein